MSSQKQPWLEQFQIAIIELNEKKINSMLDDMPSFENIEQMKIALALMAQAQKSLKVERQAIKKDMLKIKKSKAFLEPYMNKKVLFDKSF